MRNGSRCPAGSYWLGASRHNCYRINILYQDILLDEVIWKQPKVADAGCGMLYCKACKPYIAMLWLAIKRTAK